MKNIHITESQLKHVLKLKETIKQAIDVKPGESLDTAVRNANREVTREAPNANINFVIPKEELSEDIEGDGNILERVADNIIERMGNDVSTISFAELLNEIDAEYCNILNPGRECVDIPRGEILRIIDKKIYNPKKVSESAAIYTKKQIKEARRNNRIANSKVLTKSEILKSLK